MHVEIPSRSVKMGVGLLFSLALLWSSSSASTTKQCFSKERTNLIINASAAFLARTTVLDARISLSQQACLLDCCSQEVFKCNWAVYRPDKPSGSENCYLFYCEREEDCPLIPMNGVNSYNIFTGVDYPSMNHLTTTKVPTQPSTTPRVTITVTAKPTYVTTPSTPTATTHTSTITAVTTPTQPATTTQPTTTTIATLPPTTTQPSMTTTVPSMTTTLPSMTTTLPSIINTQPSITDTTTSTTTPQPSSTTTYSTQPTTTLPNSQPTTTTTESAPTALVITSPTSILQTDPTTNKTATTSTQVAMPIKPINVSMQKPIVVPALTPTVPSPLSTEMKTGTGPTETTTAKTTCTTLQATLATTITTTTTSKTETQTSTTKPNKNIKNHNKATRKQAMKPSPYKTRLGTTVTTTVFPYKHHLKLTTANTKQSSTTRPPGSPHKTAFRKPKTDLRTSDTTIKAKVSTPHTTTSTTATPTMLVTQSSAATVTPLQATAMETKSMLVAPPQPAPPTAKPGHPNPPKRNTAHQRTLKSTLEVAVVVGLLFLALVIALVGRKAMESFNRRQYTRLELNDLYYDV